MNANEPNNTVDKTFTAENWVDPDTVANDTQVNELPSEYEEPDNSFEIALECNVEDDGTRVVSVKIKDLNERPEGYVYEENEISPDEIVQLVTQVVGNALTNVIGDETEVVKIE
ncbi:hypothetical protein HNP86_002019 [Methanococcus maripaludis]|uniref:Uncharacterized protein n=1 Tax=Methanococcus maripaludis TaxID=39152 RepID=A0A7J9NVZ8_METMI|nr:hypothetical protein [Methanococcus maripaludis]MBA2851860.1 hypothetical protein [Methanococcus maripaludis]